MSKLVNNIDIVKCACGCGRLVPEEAAIACSCHVDCEDPTIRFHTKTCLSIYHKEPEAIPDEK